MPDKVERLVGKALPVFQGAVTAAAAEDHSLAQLVPVIQDASGTLPYRQVGAAGREGREPLERLKGTVEWAYEFTCRQSYDLEQLDVSAESLKRLADTFAKSAHERERDAVFSLLKADDRRRGPLSADSLRAVLTEVNRSCRFVGVSPVAEEEKKSGALEEVKRYSSGKENPPGTGGMLVPLHMGPVVMRLVDGLVVDWVRLSPTEVEVQISERFFLDDPGQAVWFDAVARAPVRPRRAYPR
jgi:hypothetical protein